MWVVAGLDPPAPTTMTTAADDIAAAPAVATGREPGKPLTACSVGSTASGARATAGWLLVLVWAAADDGGGGGAIRVRAGALTGMTGGTTPVPWPSRGAELLRRFMRAALPNPALRMATSRLTAS